MTAAAAAVAVAAAARAVHCCCHRALQPAWKKLPGLNGEDAGLGSGDYLAMRVVGL